MKEYKVRYRGTSNEWIIKAPSAKLAKLEFHKAQEAAGQAPVLYSEGYIQASKV